MLHHPLGWVTAYKLVVAYSNNTQRTAICKKCCLVPVCSCWELTQGNGAPSGGLEMAKGGPWHFHILRICSGSSDSAKWRCRVFAHIHIPQPLASPCCPCPIPVASRHPQHPPQHPQPEASPADRPLCVLPHMGWLEPASQQSPRLYMQPLPPSVMMANNELACGQCYLPGSMVHLLPSVCMLSAGPFRCCLLR